MNPRYVPFVILALLGAGWGLSQPLAKIVVSGGYQPIGMIFWQSVIGVLAMAIVTIIRGKRLPLGWPQVRLYLIIAFVGTLIPNFTSYESARHLPSGVISILISTMPIFAFPLALAFGVDRFSWMRLSGLVLGLIGVFLLIGPDALPDAAMAAFIPLAIVAPLFYALEGNIVAKWGTYDCDPIQVLLGASIIGVVVTAPLTLISGQWIDPRLPWDTVDWVLLLMAVIHVFAYSGYVWLVGQTGSIFAAQVSYLVTAFGVVWAMLILSESYSNWIWAALGLIFFGMFLVQPRARKT